MSLKGDLEADKQISSVSALLTKRIEASMGFLKMVSTRDNRIAHGWHKFIPQIKQNLYAAMKKEYITSLVEGLRTGSKVDVRIKRRKAYYFKEQGNCDHSGTMTIFG